MPPDLALFALILLGFFRLVMTYRAPSRRSGDRVTAANFMPGNGTNGGAFGGSRRLFGIIRMSGNREAHHCGKHYDTTHQDLHGYETERAWLRKRSLRDVRRRSR